MVAGVKVLVVDDDPIVFERLRSAFEADAQPFEVANAVSGPRALGLASATPPDAVIVDGALPGMDGYTFTAEFKADGALNPIPVIILSDDPTEALALRARQVGAAAHLPLDGEASSIVAKVKALSGVPAQVASAAPPTAGPAAAQTSAPAPTPGAPIGGLAPTQSGAPAEYAPPAPTPAQVQQSASAVVEARDKATASDTPAVDDLLRLMIDRNASDLHLTVGSPPGLRMRGDLAPVENMRALTPKDTQSMLLSILSEDQRKRYENELELDFAYSLPGVSRFRANIFQQRGSMGAVFRRIPLRIPSLEDLCLPKVAKYLAERPRGLVLVTGPTGSGKSTTLAAMVDHINATRKVHIITLEDPIEFMHQNKMAYVNQREIGEDTASFAAALKRVLRQDPDVILVGEMRDLETISAAITAAETGHLVLATLHTTGGPETVDRIIDVFPPHQQAQVRTQLGNSLEGVLSQVLLRSTDGRSRVMAMEIMLGVPAISNLIREGKTHQMDSIIQGGAQFGMQTLDQHLRALLNAGKITWDEAVSKSSNPRDLAGMMGRKL
jgi:twitching motility protein PilT